jgi:hypothetical protein
MRNKGTTTPYHLYMERICVDFAVYSYCANSKFLCSADDTTRDFPSRKRVQSELGREVNFRTCSLRVSCQNEVYGQETVLTLCVYLINSQDLSRR